MRKTKCLALGEGSGVTFLWVQHRLRDTVLTLPIGLQASTAEGARHKQVRVPPDPALPHSPCRSL